MVKSSFQNSSISNLIFYYEVEENNISTLKFNFTPFKAIRSQMKENHTLYEESHYQEEDCHCQKKKNHSLLKDNHNQEGDGHSR